jgi:hypothetical protein
MQTPLSFDDCMMALLLVLMEKFEKYMVSNDDWRVVERCQVGAVTNPDLQLMAWVRQKRCSFATP